MSCATAPSAASKAATEWPTGFAWKTLADIWPERVAICEFQDSFFEDVADAFNEAGEERYRNRLQRLSSQEGPRGRPYEPPGLRAAQEASWRDGSGKQQRLLSVADHL